MGMAAETQFHVLAVDDSLIDRMLIERLLKTSSFQVTAVDSGSKALKILGLNEDEQRNADTNISVASESHQDVEVNLIITDYCMPGMTGYDLLVNGSRSKSGTLLRLQEIAPMTLDDDCTQAVDEFARTFNKNHANNNL